MSLTRTSPSVLICIRITATSTSVLLPPLPVVSAADTYTPPTSNGVPPNVNTAATTTSRDAAVITASAAISLLTTSLLRTRSFQLHTLTAFMSHPVQLGLECCKGKSV